MPSEANRLDPTHTTTLRESFIRAFRKRFAKLQRAVRALIVDEDAFGLKAGRDYGLPTLATAPPSARDVVFNTRFAFTTDKEKVQAFREWLQGQIDADILEVDAANAGAPWTAPYIGSAYRQGLNRAYADINSVANATNLDFYAGTKNQFLLDAFNAPEAVGKLELLATRSFEELKGISDKMASELNVILADGISHGRAPLVIAKQMSEDIANVSRVRAERIARTEIINAHAEGQLDAFERLGVEEVGVLAEWRTAGDERVCALCSALEGAILTIDEARGLLPRHPNCRCAWLPANVGEKTKGQQWAKSGIDKRFRESIKAEHPGLSPKEAKDASRWQGADKKISDKSAIKPKPANLPTKQSAIAEAKEKAIKEAAEKRAALKALAEKRAAQAALAAKKADLTETYKLHKWDWSGDKLGNAAGSKILKAKGFDGGMSKAGSEFVDAFAAADTIEGQLAVVDTFLSQQAAKLAAEAAEKAAKEAAEKAAKELADKVAKVLDAGKAAGLKAEDLTPDGNLNFPALSKLMKANDLDSTNLPDDVFLAIFDNNADPLKAIATAEEWSKYVGGAPLQKYGLTGKDIKPDGTLKTFALDDVVETNGLIDGEGLTNAQWQYIQTAPAKDAIKKIELWAKQKAEEEALAAALDKIKQEGIAAVGKYGLGEGAFVPNDIVLKTDVLEYIAKVEGVDWNALTIAAKDEIQYTLSPVDAIAKLKAMGAQAKAAAMTDKLKDLGLSAADVTAEGTLTSSKTVELVNAKNLGPWLSPDDVEKLFSKPLPADEAIALIDAKAADLASVAKYGLDPKDVAPDGTLFFKGIQKVTAGVGVDYDDLPEALQDKLANVSAAEAVKLIEAAGKKKVAASDLLLENFTLKELPTKLGGSTGAKLVEVTHADGSVAKYVMKAYRGNEEQVKNEWLANALYKRFGTNAGAPGSKIGVVDGQHVVFNPFVEGIKELGSFDATLAKAYGKKAHDDFVMDAWLANWDVVGLSQDNMAVDAAGNIVRLDNGGALLFRAQGTPKGSAFGDTVTEIATLRDKVKNASAAKVFGDIDDDKLLDLLDKFADNVKDAGGVQAIADTIAQAGFSESQRALLVSKLTARHDDLLKQRDVLKAKKAAKNAPTPNQRKTTRKKKGAAAPARDVYDNRAAMAAHKAFAQKELSSPELSAVRNFTGTLYGKMNRAALAGKPSAALDRALDKLPGYTRMTGRGEGYTMSKGWFEKWKSGEWSKVWWKSYSSTSAAPERVFDSTNGICYIIKNKGINGGWVQPISSVGGEEELLMRRDATFRVVGWAHSPNGKGRMGHRNFIVMEEVEDGSVLPESQGPPPELDADKLWDDFTADAKAAGIPNW